MGFIKDQLGMNKKTEDERVIPEQILDYLILGNDLSLVTAWNTLKMNGSSVELLAEGPCAPLDISNPYGINLWRGPGNKEILSKAFAGQAINDFSIPSLFFKDQKFRAFGGKHKPMPFLYQEELLELPFGKVDLSHLNELLSSFNNAMDICYVDYIDRLEDSSWLVRTKDERCFRAKELIFGHAPFRFLDWYLGKSNLSEEVFEAIQETKNGHIFYVEWMLTSEVTEKEETIFIPQSLTYEHGHFVGQFLKGKENAPKCVFMTFLDENEHSEHEIAKKIRLLKRQLGKIFPGFEKNISTENFIHLAFNPLSYISDKFFQQIKTELPNLSIKGPGAPLKDFSNEESEIIFGPARSFYSVFELLKNTVEINSHQSTSI